MNKDFIEYQNNCLCLIKTDTNNIVAKKIIKLSWNVSFDGKCERIEKIENFIKENQLKIFTVDQIEYNTLELIISFSHFRRSKF
ncbi:MAG TPA: hypothetical protein QF753_19100 [Victivallales bacterium]|nr:hypothetical protein [Victivallales bacterium]